MQIQAIGNLAQNKQIEEWHTSQPVAVPYFDGQLLTFTLDGLTDSDEADATSAIEAFLRLTPRDRIDAAEYVFRVYTQVAETLDDDDLDCKITAAAAVWRHVRPSQIFVARRHRRDRSIYVQITAECDWEREHGLQIVYRRGVELSRVSDQDGHLTHSDAYDLPEEEDKIA